MVAFCWDAGPQASSQQDETFAGTALRSDRRSSHKRPAAFLFFGWVTSCSCPGLTGRSLFILPCEADFVRVVAKKLHKRTPTNLYNGHPTWLALAHEKLDAAVATAYGWPADLADEEILARLLALNLERGSK